MRHEIIERQARAMRAAGLDAIISSSPENFAYVTGYPSPTQSLMRWRHAMALVTANADASLLVVDMEATTIRARQPDADIAVWKEFAFDCMQVLADLIERKGLASSRVGLELDHLPAADFAELQKLLPSARFELAQALLARMRQIKTDEEIELLRKLSRIADRSITEAYGAVKEGDSEMDLAAALTRGVYEHGAEYFKLMIIATGERSIFPNVGPTTRKLKRGDVCRVEIFPMINGYHAGVCRTAAVGEPPAHAERIWANLTQCKHMLLRTLKPGIGSRRVYELYLDKLRELAMTPISFIGHGIGLHLHEDPYLGPTPDQPLEAGMVLGIEPLVMDTGYGFGMQNKDMICITKTGCELLSDYANTDRLIIV
jgi:Xaa-Pro aminopeptidase